MILHLEFINQFLKKQLDQTNKNTIPNNRNPQRPPRNGKYFPLGQLPKPVLHPKSSVPRSGGVV